MRKLRVDEIDFRVGMIKKSANGAFCTLLAYKDARVDMAMLDEEFGQMYWQSEYKRDSKGVLQCGIGVFCQVNNQWVWKWSNGIESNTEKQKGEYSDAFKRAGFMWGIGRELYDMPTLFVNLKQDEYYEQNGKVKQSNKFKPNDWEWTITDEVVQAKDANGVRVNVSVKTAPPKKVVKFGTEAFTKVVDWIVEEKGTIAKAVQLYDIDEDELKKAIMVKKELT